MRYWEYKKESEKEAKRSKLKYYGFWFFLTMFFMGCGIFFLGTAYYEQEQDLAELSRKEFYTDYYKAKAREGYYESFNEDYNAKPEDNNVEYKKQLIEDENGNQSYALRKVRYRDPGEIPGITVQADGSYIVDTEELLESITEEIEESTEGSKWE